MPGVSRRALCLLALALLGLLQAAFFLSSAPPILKAGIAGLLALAVVRPGLSLMLWAGLAPLSTSIVALAGTHLPGSQLLESMTLAVITGAVARNTRDSPTRLALPALVMGVVALASGLSELPARLITVTQEHAGAIDIARLLFQHAVDRIDALEPWYFGLLIAECAALAWAAESLARQDTELGPRVVWCALAGHAGVGVLNVIRVVGGSLRSGEFPATLPNLLLTIREHTQYDVNAAASILVMVILAGVGLASRRARLPLALMIGVTVIALWVAGSRIAMAALLVTLAGLLALRTRHSTRTAVMAGAAVLVSAAVITWLATGYPTNRNLKPSAAIASRTILFKAALGMAWHAPVVGVGTGTFLEESPYYGAWQIQSYVHDARIRDNAHNYFLQTLAEQGVIGLLALLAVLGTAIFPALRGTPHRDPMTKWLAGGIIASILTWLTGHPLLVAEAALVFWLFIGVLAARSEVPPGRADLRWLAAAALVAIVVSIPFRAAKAEREAHLEHLATGVSAWHTDVEGRRYRTAGAEFSLFLPSGTVMVLPIRTSSTSEVRLELHLDSRPIDAVIAEPGEWREFRIQVPESPSRFVKLGFTVAAAPGSCQQCVWVGKATPLVER